MRETNEVPPSVGREFIDGDFMSDSFHPNKTLCGLIPHGNKLNIAFAPSQETKSNLPAMAIVGTA